MDEAILIEIAQRFRKLEDAVEAADILHVERIERGNLAAKERDDTNELRDALEKTLEACRDDMVSMQEAIRRAFDPTAPKAAKSIP